MSKNKHIIKPIIINNYQSINNTHKIKSIFGPNILLCKL